MGYFVLVFKQLATCNLLRNGGSINYVGNEIYVIICTGMVKNFKNIHHYGVHFLIYELNASHT